MAGPDISIVVPARNEEKNIPELVKEITGVFSKTRFSYELILVDDNSTDSTPEICDSATRSSKPVRCVHRIPPPGFGRAIKDGLRASRGKVVVIAMGDRSDQPEDILTVAKKALSGTGVAYGSRFIRPGLIIGYPQEKMLFNRIFNSVARLLLRMPEKDITNAFKAYRREVLDAIGISSLKSTGFDLTIELPVRAHHLGFSSAEVPVRWVGRRAGIAKMNAFKVGIPYGLRLLDLLALEYTGRSWW